MNIQQLFAGRIKDTVYLISRRTKACPIARHYGVLVPVYGRYLVFHYSNNSKVEQTSLESFLDGHELLVHETRPIEPYEKVLSTAQYGYKTPLYSLSANNCEHFARWAFSGKEESHQTQIVGIVAVFFFLMFLK